jgi:TPR repeat protein
LHEKWIDCGKRECSSFNVKLSAHQAHATHQCCDRKYLQNGPGISCNLKSRALDFKLSAHQGNGPRLPSGIGMSKHFKSATHYSTLSADSGHPDGQYCCGLCFRDGTFDSKDFDIPDDDTIGTAI